MTLVLVELVTSRSLTDFGKDLRTGDGWGVNDNACLIDAECIVACVWGFCSMVLGVFFKLNDLDKDNLDHFGGMVVVFGQGSDASKTSWKKRSTNSYFLANR